MAHDRRKADHIRINLEENVQFPHVTTGLERYRFVHQALPELNLHGARNFAARAATMELDKLDFTGKTVLDLGCNLGAFCFYASAHGARRVVGGPPPIRRQKQAGGRARALPPVPVW